MKYVKNYLFALAVAALAVAACDKTTVPEYEEAPATTNEQVFFPASVGDQIKIADGETSFTLPLQRGTANLEAIDVEIAASGEGVEYFTVPGTATFASNAKTTTITITVTDPVALGKNNFYPLTLSIADESLTTPYGRSSVTFLAGIELPWVKFDKGTYYTWWNDAELERTMEYQQISETMRYCRIQNFWDDEDDPMDIFWYWDTETNYCFITPTILEPYDGENNCVMSDMASFYTMYQGWEGDVGKIGSDEWFAWAGPWMAKRDDVPYYDGNGTFHLADWFYIASTEDGVPTGRGWQFGGEGDWFKGASYGDYTLSIEYSGMYVNPDNEAVPIINFASTKKSSKYYDTIKYMITDQNTDALETLDVIVEGKDEAIETLKLTNGAASVQPALEPGLYRVVAAAYVKGDKDDKGNSTEIKTIFAETIDFYFPGLDVAPKEVEGAVYLLPMADLFGEDFCAENGYYDYNSFGSVIEGAEIKSGVRGLFKTSVAENYPIETLVANCSALTDAQIESINTKGYYANGYINRDPETSYTFVVELTNVYGASKVFTATYTTAALPYDGELVIGDYTLTGEDGSCTITLLPSEEETAFYVQNLGIEDGSSWLAEYDSAAGTLTLDGTLKGYEQYGPLFGAGAFYLDSAHTMYYGTYVFADEESYGDDSLVFTVDPDTKQLSSILQDVAVIVFYDEDDSFAGFYSYFEAGSSVSLASASSVSKSSVRKKSLTKSGAYKMGKADGVKVPYRIGCSEEADNLPAASFKPTLGRSANQGWGTASVKVRSAKTMKLVDFELK